MNIKEKLQSAKDWVTDHKKEIIEYGLIGIGTIAGIYVGGKLLDRRDVKALDNVVNSVKGMELPKLDIGTVTGLERDEYGYNFILNDVVVGDMGRFGQELLKLGDDVSEDTTITAWMGVLTK